MPEFINISDQKFGRLTAISEGPRGNAGQIQWLCQCECGKRVIVRGSNLRTGSTVSCGCWKAEIQRARMKEKNTTHGRSERGNRTRGYVAWINMIQRCTNPNVDNYPNYGGRGIVVCERWLQSSEAFLADMGEPPAAHSLERKDVDGNYCPENCCWETTKAQSNNKQNSRFLEFNGVKKTVSEWAESLGMSRRTLNNRITRLGWTVEDALGQAPSPISRKARGV